LALLEVNDLKTHFFTREGVVQAVDGVSFSLEKGKTLGIVGESGCGKSVTALSIMGLIPKPPARIVGGEVLFDGKDLTKLSEGQMQHLRGDEVAMIFQDPMTSLNPTLKIGTQITETIRAHRDVSKMDARKRAVELLEEVGIPRASERLDDYPHRFSGGMRQRVMIAIALSCDPALLIADNPTTALDVTIQIQILDLVKQLRDRLGMGVLWITHDLGVVAKLCDRVVIMYAGEVMEQGDVYSVLKRPRHPYTRRLIDALPKLGRPEQRLMPIEGRPPDPANLPVGCPFAPRCQKARAECEAAEVPLIETGEGRAVRCLFPED
jgi:peptide/nickel transport system ATP-binding protein